MSDLLNNEVDRKNSILNGTADRFYFQHQNVNDVAAFSNGVFKNFIDINPFGMAVYDNVQRAMQAADLSEITKRNYPSIIIPLVAIVVFGWWWWRNLAK